MAMARSRTTWRRRIARLFGRRTPDQPWRVGAAGERAVGRMLRVARVLGWRSLHGVPLGLAGTDIDHLLVGPGGIVCLNTKHHRRARVRAGDHVIFVRGEKTGHAQASLREAERAGLLLSASLGYEVTVTPVIVFVGAARVRGRKAAGVRVLTRAGLLPWLLFRGPRMGAAQRDEIYAAARQSTTWQL